MREAIGDEARRKEAADALERVARESETLGGSTLARAAKRVGDHFSGADAIGEADDGATDPIEVWGRRIGRALSVILFIVLLTGLIAHFANR